MRLLFSALTVVAFAACGVDRSGLAGDDGGVSDLSFDTSPPVDLSHDFGVDMTGADVVVPPDMPVIDLGVDLGPPDLGPPDLGPPDLGPPDLGPPDLGPPDLGPPDLGPPDMCPPSGDVDCVMGTACTCDCGFTCNFHCPGGSCNFTCNGASTCTFDCSGGHCTIRVTGFSSATGTCSGDHCTETCSGGNISMMCSSASLSCSGSTSHTCF